MFVSVPAIAITYLFTPLYDPFFIVEQEGVYVLLVFTECRKIAFDCDHNVKLNLQLQILKL